MSLDLLRSFLAVYRSGSITGAAKGLYLTQPAVSQHIKSLELSVGQSLFKRLPRGMEPTPAGHDLAQLVSDSIDRLSTAVEVFRGGGGQIAGVVSIGGPQEFLHALVIPALAAASPGELRLHFRLGLSGALLEALHAQELDFVISTVRVSARGFLSIKLFVEEFVLVANPSWAARLGTLPEDAASYLNEASWVSYAEELPLIRRYYRVVLGCRHQTRASFVVPDLRAVLEATCSGAGITVLPRYLAAPAIREGRLVELLKTDNPPTNDIFLVWRRGVLSATRNRFVKECLLRAAQDW